MNCAVARNVARIVARVIDIDAANGCIAWFAGLLLPHRADGARGQASGMLLGCWSEWCDMGNWR
jgi:hypothetical protein